jgi:hypothetical protein
VHQHAQTPSGRRFLVDAAMVALATVAAQVAGHVGSGISIPPVWLLAFGLLTFALLQVLSRDGVDSGLDAVRTVLAAVVLALLALLIVRSSLGFQVTAVTETVRQAAFVAAYTLAGRMALAWRSPEMRERARRPGTPAFEFVTARELARARRHEQPLTLVVLDVRPGVFAGLFHRSRILRRASGELSGRLRLTDALGEVQGRLVAILTDTGRDDARAALIRLRADLANQAELLEQLELGYASFPEDEVTLVGLHERALERRRPFLEQAAESASTAPRPSEAVA